MGLVDRRMITHVNWSLLCFTVLLYCVGVANLYSASGVRIEDGIQVGSYFEKQLVWGGVGLCCMVMCTLFHYRHLRTLAFPLFLCALVMLLLVPVIGKTVLGARRWLDFGLFSLQPSEVAKISTLLMGASLLARYKEPLTWRQLAFVLSLLLLPCALIFSQPDLGTTMLLILLLGGIVLYRGVKKYVFYTCLVVLPPLVPMIWFYLKPYQKKRIEVFLNPTLDPKGAGYHILMSQIAIGSGELSGKGFLEGTHHLLRFLPEKHTDFAVAVFSEEWGFIGCVTLVALFCGFLLCIVRTASSAKDRFGSILCAGVFFYFFWQILINIGMVIGLMPVVGVPLPFISYGGTATIVNFIMLGFVMNVSMRRYMFKSA